MLLGTSKLTFKGSPSGRRGKVHGGDIGVNDVGGDMDVCGNFNMTLDDNTQANADSLHASEPLRASTTSSRTHSRATRRSFRGTVRAR